MTVSLNLPFILGQFSIKSPSICTMYVLHFQAHSRSQKRAGPAQSSHKTQAPQPVSSQKDETSEMKDELKKAYRRIADLETRIHDLTLQSSLVSIIMHGWVSFL